MELDDLSSDRSTAGVNRGEMLKENSLGLMEVSIIEEKSHKANIILSTGGVFGDGGKGAPVDISVEIISLMSKDSVRIKPIMVSTTGAKHCDYVGERFRGENRVYRRANFRSTLKCKSTARDCRDRAFLHSFHVM